MDRWSNYVNLVFRNVKFEEKILEQFFCVVSSE